jgi:formylglycine-generating enzyme required for sulfatase activity
MNSHRFIFLYLIAISIVLAACGGQEATAQPEPTIPLVQLADTATQTAATEAPTVTTVPSATPEPTPTATPIPTETLVPTPIPTPTLGIGASFISPLTGARMVYVPGGDFLMGSQSDDPLAFEDETPQRAVLLEAFWINETEITNREYADFLSAFGNQEEGGVLWLGIGADHVQVDQSRNEFIARDGFEDYPVVGVSWYGAQAYCAWLGGRLPTEAEWEKAARGTEAYPYPWGADAPTGSLLNIADVNLAADYADYGINDGFAGLAPVGTYPEGASPYGALDMAGNVWEWVSDWYGSEAYATTPAQDPIGVAEGVLKVARGGSYLEHTDFSRTAYRAAFPPAAPRADLGFRCITQSGPAGTSTREAPDPFALRLFKNNHPSYRIAEIQETADGGYFLVGSTYATESYAGEPTELWVVHLDPDGRERWQRAMGHPDADLADGGTAAFSRENGNLIIAGYYGGSIVSGKYSGQPWVIELDSEGNRLWEQTLPGIRKTSWVDVVTTDDGTMIVAGNDFHGANIPGIHLWRLDENGALLDTRQVELNLGGGPGNWGTMYAPEETLDGGFVLVSRLEDASRQAVLAVLRFDSQADLLWWQTYSFNVEKGSAVDIVHLRAGGFALAFTVKGPEVDGPVIGKINEQGDPHWWVNFPFSLITVNQVADARDGVVAAGWGLDGAWIGHFNADGLLLKQSNFETDPDGIHIFHALDQTSDGGYIAAGEIHLGGGADVLMVRYGEMLESPGCAEITPADYGSVLLDGDFLETAGTNPSIGFSDGAVQSFWSEAWTPQDQFTRLYR